MLNRFLLNVHARIQTLVRSEDGQDLVEYALVVALIALSATVSMRSLAGGIKNAFNSVSNVLATDI
ncbi:MAG: Flp family type IVb pilin [Terracidiphilus sp.]